MRNSKTIVIYIDVIERYNFFQKLFKPLTEMHDIYIITARLSIFFLCKLQGVKVHLFKHKETIHESSKYLKNSLSVLNHYHTKREADLIYSIVQSQLLLLQSKIDIESIFLWNGSTTVGFSIGDFAKEHKVKIYYFEISNLGKKVFVDCEGVNAQSHLYNHPYLLDNVHISDKSFTSWRENWKKDLAIPKQAKNSTKLPFSFFIDIIGFYIFNLLKEDRRSPFSVLKTKLFLKNYFVDMKISNVLPDTFIFFAMQVSNDSQLLINSDISNLEALKIAIDLSHKEKSSLVVKLHPAEMDVSFIEKVNQLAKEDRFVLTTLSTKELIGKSKKVVVINSTVGLEAMIEEKEVLILGRAIYQEFSKERLKSYILDYLVDIDYFDRDEEVSLYTIKKVLNRCRT